MAKTTTRLVSLTLAALLSVALVPAAALTGLQQAWGEEENVIAAELDASQAIEDLDNALESPEVDGADRLSEETLAEVVAALDSTSLSATIEKKSVATASSFPSLTLQNGRAVSYNIETLTDQILNFNFSLSTISLIECDLTAVDYGSKYYNVGLFGLYNSNGNCIDTVYVDHNDTLKAGWILPAGNYTLKYLSRDYGYKQRVTVGYNIAESGTSRYQMIPSYERGDKTIPSITVGGKYLLGVNFWGAAQTVENEDIDGHYYQFTLKESRSITITIGSYGNTMVGLYNSNDGLIGATQTNGTSTESGVGSYTSPILQPGTYVVKVLTDDYRALGNPFLLSVNYTPQSISGASVTVASKTYTGKSQKATSATVKVGGKTLKAGTDYTISSKSGKNVGSYTATIKGKGNYTGTKSVTFKIVPKGTSVKKLAKGKKAFTVTWKKPSKPNLKQITGYQVRWSTAKSMKGAKSKTVKTTMATGKKCSLKVSKLKANKKYYVQVRTYKKVGGKTYYSSWSKAKTVKTKK